MQVRGADRVRGDLVLDDGGAEHRPHEPSGASRRAGADDAHHILVDLVAQLGEHTLGRTGRVSFRPQVGARDDVVALVDDDSLRGNGADVDSDSAVHERDSFFMASMS